MASYGTMRIETLNKDNYETWRIQMKALLIKSDSWVYVSGTKRKPELVQGDQKSKEACDEWAETDEKAKADIILCISPSELKQVKNCESSSDIWTKLEQIYQSKGPARKASLLKSLIQHKMTDSNNGVIDIRDHLRKFFDIVDKLSEMEIKIDEDLLAVMLLYSLPSSFENFRCAIESRDELPKPDVLRIKIVEENDARRHDEKQTADSGAFAASHFRRKPWNNKTGKFQQRKNDSENPRESDTSKIRCYKCKRLGHRAAQCYSNQRKDNSYPKQENVGLLTNAKSKDEADALCTSKEMQIMWCLDSGCTRHLCNDDTRFVNIGDTEVTAVNLANNGLTEVKGSGKALINAEVNKRIQTVEVFDTLLVPELRTNLLSVAKLCDRGYTVTFNKNIATIRNQKAKLELIAERKDNLYYLRGSDVNVNQSARHVSESLDSSKNKTADLVKWHCRMGHLNIKDLVDSTGKGNIRGLNLSKSQKDFNCEVCAINKLTRAPFPKQSERKTEVLDMIHSDLCGPMRIPSVGRSIYFITFIDDFSRHCVVKFLKRKSEALDAFKEVKSLWENQKSTKIKIFMSDNGGEFINSEFDNFLKLNGIERRLTVPYCPEQCGIAERKNRTLVEMARCLLSQAKLPLNLWAEAINTANYVRNRCPTKALNGKTSYEMWNNVTPNVSYFKVFGCTAYCLENRPSHKFSARSKKGIFVGYSDISKAFRVYFPNEKRFIVSRSVKFFEESDNKPYAEVDELFLKNNPSAPIKKDVLEIEIGEKSAKQSGLEREIKVQTGELQIETNESAKSDYLGSGDSVPSMEKDTLSLRNREVIREIETADIAYNCNTEVPIKTALKSIEAPQWYNALVTEMKSVLKNDTFELVDRPTSQKCIGSRFVLTNKYSPDGSLLKKKARFVAKGFNQKPGVDFGETFAPVARQGSIRIMAALAAELGLDIHQFDVTTAYLNGTLDEKIFMECPDYFREILEQIIVNENTNTDVFRKASKMLRFLNNGKVLLLKKSLYGLKQAGRCWNFKLNEILNDFGAKQTDADPCMYYIKGEKGLTIIIVYVDDILFMSQDPVMIEMFKTHLTRKLEFKYAGFVQYCLGINFRQENGVVAMSQQSYIRELLNRFDMSEAKPVACPMDVSIRLKKGYEYHEDALPYRELVGGLMYLATSTRPDISNSVSQLSQFLNCFDQTHWTAAKRVLRYLKKTINFGLIFRHTNEPLFGYTDADWGNCLEDRKSYTGYCFILSGSSISWESRKQCTVALSSTEAEYMALSDGTKEAIYVCKLLNELCDVKLKNVCVLTDNIGAIKLTENPVFHKRTKHIDVRHHFVREALRNGHIDLKFVPTESMGADVLTKALSSPKHYKCLSALGIEDTVLYFG